MTLDYFINSNLYKASRQFFSGLNIPLKPIQEAPVNLAQIGVDSLKESESILNAYAIGLVDDEAFISDGLTETNALKQIRDGKGDYPGIVVVAIELNQPTNGYSRGFFATIVRGINRHFKNTPVVALFRYGTQFCFASVERTTYKQSSREGEKAGKVSLLKNISLEHPHRGHIDILNLLRIPISGREAVTNFFQLYYYWQSRFSISVLNQNFYKAIIAWFNKAIVEIRIPGENKGSEKHKDFIVRLIARLIFIWFLKELKVVKEELLLPELANGNENKLIKPKQKGSYYYKFILQNLFFNTLNREKLDRDKNSCFWYEGQFENIEQIRTLIEYSPFLNGGLFDAHENDWYFDNKVVNDFEVPDKLLIDKEEGLNGILSKFKFTIAENTPLEQEIAVDPEMLGRIFENLLAEQSDDTRETARKNKGVFYTPRPVVSYMCRNTLLKHLNYEITPGNGKEIVGKLLDTKVLDPACGSGAFPMGMLEEMMQVLDTADPDGKIWIAEMLKSKDDAFRELIADMVADGQIRYVKKLGLLRNCLFGIDILDYAIEITKLRCWLSLIVEQRVDFNKPNYNLKPLPNLEFKFYQKNSLYRFYKKMNLNDLIDPQDKEGLLDELVNLENQFFIVQTDRIGTKEQLKERIVKLLERIVEAERTKVEKEYKSALTGLNQLISNRANESQIKKQKSKVEARVKELAELSKFHGTIKDYFIERVVFPGIFNKENQNPGFDIVIGNPPYVNTKLISSMGISKKLEEEYGYCDDLYNHFTFRGLELLKKGGLLSYITSDTFLTLQTKKNMRMEFLGIPKITKTGDGLFAEEKKVLPECRVTEIINTPKAFAALVDTAIFCLKKEEANDITEMVYIDIRKPNANSFNITEEEWKQIKTSKENLSGWERILDRTFSALGHDTPKWKNSHTCDGDKVFNDENSSLLKFKVSFEPYRKAINYAIFSPTEYNCQILEKIVKTARPLFDTWWSKIETSRLIENNRSEIKKFNSKLSVNQWAIIGLATDGGVGLQTGDNGRFVGYRSTSRFAVQCSEARIQKLWNAIQDEPKIKRKFDLLSDCNSYDDVKEVLDDLKEVEIWELFDGIKEKFGLRIFGKGFMYRIIPETMIFDVLTITEKQKIEGIIGKRIYVPYDKGDREGNRWYLETPYLIDWSEEAVDWLKSHSGHSGAGMPVVRNPQFYFRNGFCWTNVLNPNSTYFKCRLKDTTVNDVGSMSLYDKSGLGDKYFVLSLNSYLHFKILREFFNNTVNIQMNDIRKLPIKIPSDKELKTFNQKFDECLAIKKEYFAGEIDRAEMNAQLRPIEAEIDEMVNKLYGIVAKEEIEVDELEEELDDLEEISDEEEEDEL